MARAFDVIMVAGLLILTHAVAYKYGREDVTCELLDSGLYMTAYESAGDDQHEGDARVAGAAPAHASAPSARLWMAEMGDGKAPGASLAHRLRTAPHSQLRFDNRLGLTCTISVHQRWLAHSPGRAIFVSC